MIFNLHASARPLGQRRLRACRLVLWLSVALPALISCQRDRPRPDVVMYVVDTLRADALGCYRGEPGRTPHFDRVASEGARFARAYANSSWTRPSVASLLTGHYPRTHGANGRFDRLRSDLPTLPEVLRKHGYETVGIVANPNLASTFGFRRGFDHFLELYEPVDQVRPIEPQELLVPAERVVDIALEWWRKPRQRPLFLFVFSIDPHAPYTPPPPFDRMYDSEYTGNFDGSFESLFRLAIAGKRADPRDLRHVRALYDGEVAYADHHFGRLLAELDRSPPARAPILVVTADHGEEFLEHGKLDHGQTLYEEVVRIPLLLRWPGRIAPHTSDVPVSLVELFPTLLGLLGIDSSTVAGTGLHHVLLRQRPGAPAPVLLELSLTPPPLTAWVNGTSKLIRSPEHSWYFDLATDPAEQTPKAAPPSLVQGLENVLQRADRLVPAHQEATAEVPARAREALKALGYGGFLGHESGPSPVPPTGQK